MKMSEIIRLLEATKDLDNIEYIKKNLETIIYKLKNQTFMEFFTTQKWGRNQMNKKPKLSSLGLEFLLTLFDDLRSDRFESKSPLEKFIEILI